MRLYIENIRNISLIFVCLVFLSFSAGCISNNEEHTETQSPDPKSTLIPPVISPTTSGSVADRDQSSVPTPTGTPASLAVPTSTKTVGVTARQVGSEIKITYMGGPDHSSMERLKFTVNGGAVQHFDNQPPVVGETKTVTGSTTETNRVVVTATFNDGTEQIVLDTVLGQSYSPTTSPVSTPPPTPSTITSTKTVGVTAKKVGSEIKITYMGGPDHFSMDRLEFTVNSGTVHTFDTQPPAVGDTKTVSGATNEPDRVVATAVFIDGTEQIVLDTTI